MLLSEFLSQFNIEISLSDDKFSLLAVSSLGDDQEVNKDFLSSVKALVEHLKTYNKKLQDALSEDPQGSKLKFELDSANGDEFQQHLESLQSLWHLILDSHPTCGSIEMHVKEFPYSPTYIYSTEKTTMQDILETFMQDILETLTLEYRYSDGCKIKLLDICDVVGELTIPVDRPLLAELNPKLYDLMKLKKAVISSYDQYYLAERYSIVNVSTSEVEYDTDVDATEASTREAKAREAMKDYVSSAENICVSLVEAKQVESLRIVSEHYKSIQVGPKPPCFYWDRRQKEFEQKIVLISKQCDDYSQLREQMLIISDGLSADDKTIFLHRVAAISGLSQQCYLAAIDQAIFNSVEKTGGKAYRGADGQVFTCGLYEVTPGSKFFTENPHILSVNAYFDLFGSSKWNEYRPIIVGYERPIHGKYRNPISIALEYANKQALEVFTIFSGSLGKQDYPEAASSYASILRPADFDIDITRWSDPSMVQGFGSTKDLECLKPTDSMLEARDMFKQRGAVALPKEFAKLFEELSKYPNFCLVPHLSSQPDGAAPPPVLIMDKLNLMLSDLCGEPYKIIRGNHRDSSFSVLHVDMVRIFWQILGDGGFVNLWMPKLCKELLLGPFGVGPGMVNACSRNHTHYCNELGEDRKRYKKANCAVAFFSGKQKHAGITNDADNSSYEVRALPKKLVEADKMISDVHTAAVKTYGMKGVDLFSIKYTLALHYVDVYRREKQLTQLAS